MNTHTSRVTAASGAVLLALTLGACGGGEGSSAAPEELGPLDEYFEQIYGSFDEDQGMAQMAEVEQITAECMQEQGFEYTPVDQSQGGGVTLSDEDLDVQWGTLEFAEEYGYGITTDPWADAQGEEPLPEDSGEMWVDPNEDYVNSMSETEQEAYWIALYGEQTYEEPEVDENGELIEEYEYNWEEAGCQGRASHEVYESVDGVDDDAFTALQEDMEAMWESTMSDPRVTGLEAEWASCMADAGHTGLAAIGDAENQLYEEVNAIWESAYDVDMGAEMTEEDWAAIEEENQAKLAAITPREIETAVDDFTCREDIGYDKIQREVSFEYQEEFVNAHKAELDAWVAATASS